MGSEPVLVVGGGAAGLFCAGIARRRGIPVTVLERSARPARKVLITGKGRCNLTNHCTVEEFFPRVCTNSRFLYSALRGFSPQDTMALFEQLGVPLKTERGDRVFPVSDRAADVADALVRLCGEQNIRTNTRVKEVLAQEGEVRGLLLEDGRELPAQQDCAFIHPIGRHQHFRRLKLRRVGDGGEQAPHRPFGFRKGNARPLQQGGQLLQCHCPHTASSRFSGSTAFIEAIATSIMLSSGSFVVSRWTCRPGQETMRVKRLSYRPASRISS